MMKTTTRMMLIVSLGVIGCGDGESTSAGMTIGASSTGSTGSDPTTMTMGTPGSETDMSMGSSTTMPTVDSSTTEDPMGSSSTTMGPCPDVAILGEWLSEGDDVSGLLAGDPLNITSIDATFEDLTFEVESMGGLGLITQSGTYTAEPCPGSATKYSIVLEQTMPAPLTVEGIYEIDGCEDPAVMLYEVTQTAPDMGFVPATCDDDFGVGQFGEDNTQIFRRQ